MTTPRNYSTLQSDLLMGRTNETKLMEYLNNLKENKNKQYELFRNQFSTFDFINEDTIAELKSRRVLCNQYHDTMIGNNKLKVCNEDHPENVKGAEYVFYFLFTDGLYKWKYNQNQYSVRPFFHRDKQRYQEYGYIPVKYLELVEPNLNSLSS
tara:strand:- start:1609 stop:2067 length:459 start_codon:yes stop_codon:yes gene_type:complete